MFSDGQAALARGNRCLRCRGEQIWDDENGELVCTGCGVVSSRPYQGVPQYAGGAAGQGDPRERHNLLQEAVGTPTVIDGVDVDARGRRISSGRDMRQLRRLDTMVSWDSKKRRIRKVSIEVRRIAQSLGLSPIIAERGFDIYLREFEGTTKVRSLAAASAAALCAACRELNVARPSNEAVADTAGVNRKQLRFYYRILLGGESIREIPNPVRYIPSIAAKASLGGKTERRAIELLNRAKEDPRLTGKRPVPIAAAALYLASSLEGERTTQLRLAYAAGVTPITIRKRCVELSEIFASGK
ncbi:MAG: hypothetical protein JRM80_12720 [Nitrososphaerota archaeon]|nr:hypothetical protein [Nitrososphaerota archaeon]MDG6990687.1 hypothetical protein [Nitrososphaerota archaeon]